MGKWVELAELSAETAFLSAEVLYRRGKLYDPRTSMAVFSGLNSVFPGEIARRGKTKALESVDDLSPLLIALNEMTDVGWPVYQATDTNETARFVKIMQEYLKGWRERYIEKYPGHKETVTRLINDFCLLAFCRGTITVDQIPNYLELDSGIFEAACVRVATGDNWKANTNAPTTFDELKQAYSEYLIFGTAANGQTNRELRALHALEMTMKVSDDFEGVEDDAVLGIPSFATYVREKSEGKEGEARRILGELKEMYARAAVEGGYTPGIGRLINALRWATSRWKANVEKHKPENMHRQPHELLPTGSETTTTLRHALLVNTSFRDWMAASAQ